MMTLEFHQIELRYEALRRADQKKEKRLLGSLAEHGQQTPVMVIRGERDDHYALLDGYKRVRALKKLAVDTVQAVLWELSETDALLLERLVRMEQEDSALEQGWFLRTLIDDFGLSPKELSKRLDKSASWVSRRLGLVKALPDEVIELVISGKVCAHAAERFLVPLARAKKEECLIFASAIAKEKLSTRQVALLHRGFVSGSDATRALLTENPGLYLRAAAEEQKTAYEKKTKSSLELVLDDLNIVASVSSRLGRRLYDPVLLLNAIRNDESVREAFALAKATFSKLERVLGEGEKDARSGNANGNLEAA